MMSKAPEEDTLDVENEVGAIKAILAALAPLAPTVRGNVLEYVLKRLGIGGLSSSAGDAHTTLSVGAPPIADPAGTEGSSVVAAAPHIKTFKEQKQPRSANEMAAVVAYYLAHVASKRKSTVNAKDIQDQFRIAEFPLPAQAKFTLVNARNAGYLDSAGGGEYELNAVGHNLVAHGLPRTDSAGGKARTGKRGPKRPRTKKRPSKS